MATPHIIAAIVCEDIRKEISNKDILIGVFSGDIVLPSFPSWLNLAFWLEIATAELAMHELRVRIQIGEQSPVEFKANLQISRVGEASVSLPGLQVQIDKPTELLLEQFVDGNWQVFKRKKIIKGLLPLPSHSSG